MLSDLWDLVKKKFFVFKTRKNSDIYIYEDAYDILVEKNPNVKKLKEEFGCEIC